MTCTAQIPLLMRAVVLDGYDGLNGLKLREIPVPTPGPGQVLVRVHSAGVNPVDIAVADGFLKAMFPLTFPAVAGCELAGTVVAIGDGETSWQLGDEVHGKLGVVGAYAEYALLPSQAAIRKPAAMTFAEAAALPVAVGTASAALDRGQVGEGTRVVIHAAAGGVGTIMVQLAKERGAHVIAIASTGNLDYVAALGADEVIDRITGQDEQIREADTVIDAFGPPAQERSWKMLRRGGIMVSLVSEPSAEQAEQHGVRAARVFGSMDPSLLRHADELYEAGRLKVYVTREFPLADLVTALRIIESGQARGKMVLKIADAEC